MGTHRTAGNSGSPHFLNSLLMSEKKVSERRVRMSIDTGMVVVIFISLMYMVLVFGLLFYVKNDWCDLLFKNFTENLECRPRVYTKVGTSVSLAEEGEPDIH